MDEDLKKALSSVDKESLFFAVILGIIGTIAYMNVVPVAIAIVAYFVFVDYKEDRDKENEDKGDDDGDIH